MDTTPAYNIIQFLNLPSGYASLYNSIRSEHSSDGKDDTVDNSHEAAAKKYWAAAVRILSAQDQHVFKWIEKWTFKALIYGAQAHDDRDNHTSLLVPAAFARAESVALFTDFSWYLLSGDEPKAIKILNICRSNFRLAVLPSGLKVTDVVVELDRTPADNSTLLNNNIKVDGFAMRKSQRRSSNHFSSSLHTVNEGEYREAKIDPGHKLSPQHPYHPTAEDSDVDEELPSITVTKEPSHEFIKGPAEQFQSETQEASCSTDTDSQAVLQTAPSQQGPSTNNTIILRIKIPPTLTDPLRRGILQEGDCLDKKRKPRHPKKAKRARKSKLAMDCSLDTDMHVQSDASGENLTPPKRKTACNPHSESEPPRKKRGLVSSVNGESDTTFGRESTTMQPSRQVTASASGSNDNNASADGSPITTTTSDADVISPNTTDANVVQEHEGSPQRAKNDKGDKPFLIMPNSLYVVEHLRIPLAQRRRSRGAATKAQGMIHEQYAPHPVLDDNSAAAPVHNVKKKKSAKGLRGQGRKRAAEPDTHKGTENKDHEEYIVDPDASVSNARNTKRAKTNKKSHIQTEECMPVDSACANKIPSFAPEQEGHRPESVDTDLDVNARPKKRGRLPGNKSQGSVGGNKKGKGKKKKKKIEIQTIVSPTESSHSIVNEANIPTHASSPTAVVSSSSRTAFSSPSPAGALCSQRNSSTQVSLYTESNLGSSFIRNENDNHDRLGKKSRTDLLGLDSGPPLSSNNEDGHRNVAFSSQGKQLDGGDRQGHDLTDNFQLNYMSPESDDETLQDRSNQEILSFYNSRERIQPSQTSRTPWSVPHDETNYSNNSRPPGIYDTHSWSISAQITKINFPPLQGDSLCSNPQLHKPPLPNSPPVWAQSRQELCESLSYFRAYQGGVYTHKQRAEGYLLDGYPARYDLWHSGGRYIISHGGGHSALDRLTGRVSLVEDQVADGGSCAALISSWKAAHAIVLIAGNGYRLFPYSLDNMNYVVLGYYHIVHAWEEPEPSSVNSRGYCVRWKFLFRWIEAQGSPWWLKGHDNKCILTNMPILGLICQHCGKYSLLDKTNVVTEGYNSAFLAPREDPPTVKNLKLEIRPKPPIQPVIHDNAEEPQIATSRHFWKGFWCEKCGKLSCREFWTYWKCSNCNHTLAIKAVIQTPPQNRNVKVERFISKEAGITEKISRLGSGSKHYECITFTLPFNRGRIHLIKASGQSLQLADGIFRQYQLDASNDESFFRRYSMKTHKLKGRMLSHYFSQNSGEPYEYVGGTNNTVELNKYKSVTEALEYIRSRATLALDYNPEFNEVLSAGYMAEQKMDFHSDGEKDLGPIVASLSLGSPAIMKFRPVPSKWMSDDGQLKEGRKTPPVVIELTLRHGDALVMEGAEIQEYYQHAVHPCGFRIAATARRVDIT